MTEPTWKLVLRRRSRAGAMSPPQSALPVGDPVGRLRLRGRGRLGVTSSVTVADRGFVAVAVAAGCDPGARLGREPPLV